jgi:putative ABC transport system permease protein
MPTGVEVQSASAESNTLSQLTAAFNLNLTAFSLLAVGVGMFLIYNTTMFSIVQRRRVLGILRSVGVTGDQVFRLILFESASAGAIGALLGIGLGVLLARLTVALVSQTINDLYFNVTVQSVDIQPVSLMKGFGIGMLASLVSSVVPAIEASSVNIVSVLKRSVLEERVLRSSPRLFSAGLLAVAAGSMLILLVNNVNVSFAGLFVGLVGVALCVPWLTTALMRTIAASLGRHSLITRMAARTITKALSRTSVTIATLVVAVSVMIGVSVMISSFRATVENWLGLALRADLYISPPAAGANSSVSMAPSIIETIRNVKGVEDTELLRSVSVESTEFGEVHLSAVSSITQHNRRNFRFAQGNSTDVWDQVAGGAVVVTEPFANRHNIRLEDSRSVTLLTRSGPHAFPIAGVFYDYSSDQGYVLMSLEKYREFWDDQNISGASVYLTQDAKRDNVQDEIQHAVSGMNVIIQSNSALRETALAIFDRTFAITLALRLIVIIVAFIGVLGALMVLQIERTREFGTLRAIGMTLNQMWQLTMIESGIMGAVAGALAIPVGLAIALVLIYVINFRSFGWTIFFQPVPETYLQAFLVSTTAALLASVYPMIHLGKMEAAEALREE